MTRTDFGILVARLHEEKKVKFSAGKSIPRQIIEMIEADPYKRDLQFLPYLKLLVAQR